MAVKRISYKKTAGSPEVIVHLSVAPASYRALASEVQELHEVTIAQQGRSGLVVQLNPALDWPEHEPTITRAINKYMAWGEAEVRQS